MHEYAACGYVDEKKMQDCAVSSDVDEKKKHESAASGGLDGEVFFECIACRHFDKKRSLNALHVLTITMHNPVEKEHKYVLRSLFYERDTRVLQVASHGEYVTTCRSGR